MREEEKLARDVYNYLAARWELRVFSQIAVSEGKHMEAIKALLDKYEIPDPVVTDVPGQFSRGDFQELYSRLTSEGSTSIGAALHVGATIEDLDISDLLKAIAAVGQPGHPDRIPESGQRLAQPPPLFHFAPAIAADHLCPAVYFPGVIRFHHQFRSRAWFL